MTDFKDRARKAAGEFGDAAGDKFSAFQKLSREQKALIIGFAAAVVIVLVIWLILPGKLDLTVSRIVMDGAMDNKVVIQNNEDRSLRELEVILNENYRYTISSLGPGETRTISVTRFTRNGNPGGDSPGLDTVPRIVKVAGDGGRYKVEFK